MRKVAISVILVSLTFFGCQKSITAVDPTTCDDIVTDTLGTNDNARLFVPNAFTPNSDGLNDIFRPLATNIISLTFAVYDSSGNQVFSTTSTLMGWQPLLPVNTAAKYFYKVQTITAGNHKIGKCGEFYALTCLPAGIALGTLTFEDMLTPNGFTGTTIESLPSCP